MVGWAIGDLASLMRFMQATLGRIVDLPRRRAGGSEFGSHGARSHSNRASSESQQSVAISVLKRLGSFLIFVLSFAANGAFAQAPGAPTSLGVVEEPGYNYLTWTAPADDGNGALDGYNVYACVEGNTPCTPVWKAWVQGGATTWHSDGDVTAGTTYRYAVGSHRSGENSAWSNQVTATAQEAVPDPGAPTSMSVEAEPGHNALTWTAPSDDGHGALDGYNIYRCEEGLTPCEPVWKAWVQGGDTTWYADWDVTTGTEYRYAVGSSRSGALSPWSNQDTATALEPLPDPGPPTSLRVEAKPGHNALTWTAPSDDGNGALDGYNIYRCEEGDTPCEPVWKAWVQGGDTTWYADNDITTGTTYRYAVGSSRSGGLSAWSSQGTATALAPPTPPTPAKVAPGPPFVVTARANPARATLKWEAPFSEGRPSSYSLYRGDGAGCANLTVLQTRISAASRWLEDTTVIEGDTYCYAMKARNAYGESSLSNTKVVTAIGPEAPRGFRLYSTHHREIRLIWTEPHDNGGGPVHGYNLYRCEEGETPCVPQYFDWIPLESGEFYGDRDVTAEATYRYAVASSRIGWISELSNEVLVQARKAEIPEAPVGLTARANGSRALLSWRAAAGGGVPFSYSLYRGNGDSCANLRVLLTELTADTRSVEDSSVIEGRTYCYQVTGNNSARESERSNAAVVTAVAPNAPTDLRVLSRRASALALSWSVPEDNGGGAVDSYNVFRCEEADGEAPCLPEWHAWLDTGTTFTDDDVVQGTVYRYAVSALRLFAGPGQESRWSNQVTSSTRVPTVWLFPSVSDGVRQGFVRLINHSADEGEVGIEAIDDAGMRREAGTLSLEAGQTIHFNSNDLEEGDSGKGFEGIGTGQGDWRLEFSTDLDIEVLSYIRTADGFLTAMHDVAPAGEAGHRVVTFNPASNINQVSRLRLVNPGDGSAEATVTGLDDAGVSPGDGVRVSVPAGGAVTLTSEELETGAGLTGSLGDGTGKWRLKVTSGQNVVAMSLLANLGTGHLTNLSTEAPASVDGLHEVLLFPSASDMSGRQGFVRVANRSDDAGEVSIDAVDETDADYEPLSLAIGAGETVHFNSEDLELGNAAKGLTGSTGTGTGDWRLVMKSDLDLEVLAYIRTEDGFLTSMHDVVPVAETSHRVVILNPGSNVNQVSRLRLVNWGSEASAVTVRGIDDAGASPGGEVQFSLPAGAVREYTAAQLEGGDEAFTGALGDGAGKWRLSVEASSQVRVMSLLESPTGHLTNLSTAEAVDIGLAPN